MGFRTGAFCKVWDVEPISDRKVKLRVSISQKSKDREGEYIQEFSDFPVCLGTACANQASRLKRGDTIRLGDVDVSNRFDKERRVTYYDFKIFSFEKVDGRAPSGSDNRAASRQPSRPPADEVDPDAPDLPF